MKPQTTMLAAALLGALAAGAHAQQGPPPADSGGLPRIGLPPLFAPALDQNRDGVISAEEAAKADEFVKALDRDGDGKLSAAELRQGNRPFNPAPRPDAAGQDQPPPAEGPPPGAGDQNPGGGPPRAGLPNRPGQGRGLRLGPPAGNAPRQPGEAGADSRQGPPPQDQGRGLRQGPNPAGTPGQGGPGAMRWPAIVPPLMAALDPDRDGTISAAEIANSAEALKTLDKDGSGALEPAELRLPLRPAAGLGNPQGNPQGGPQGPRPWGQPGRPLQPGPQGPPPADPAGPPDGPPPGEPQDPPPGAPEGPPPADGPAPEGA